ncbi:hypothetical protein C8Q72DRAFT_789418 [Fomitopsis betulina]|nr:hypothetical protein C8Q72DRAFT_789418 [Fomitopsis betulina]
MFPFVPRKVARASKAAGASAGSSQIRHGVIPASSASQGAAADRGQQIDVKGKGKAVDSGPSAQDCYILLCLALSDHAIWSDEHLRSRLVNAPDGYIPLRYLLSHSTTLSTLDPPPTETTIAKAIRAQDDDALQVRVLVSAPSRSAWYGKDSVKDELGGYEVRRGDWADALQRAQQLTEDDWATSTIYAESIPLQYRTLAGIARFTQSLLASPAHSTHAVQRIWLPPHAHDKPEDIPKCKGFALITLSSPEQAAELTRRWPWNVRLVDLHGVADIPEAQEAIKFGFRTMLRASWDELQEEYLAYRQTIMDALAYVEQENGNAADDPEAVFEEPAVPPAPSHLPTTDLWSLYPQGCLVFVRNIHPETNKTTLRALFSQAFTGSEVSGAGLDYVDFSKGMDTCYLRLASARHTQVLTEFFAAHPKAQINGLDTSGSIPSLVSNGKVIALEIVEGTREELYWTKVPEKVCRQAVEKAAVATGAQSESGGGEEVEAADSDKRKRKRRKRGD